ncbi:hypothetical protein QJQ45_017981 [Haematococcus lacustris]|nr:hypothetical protein QJQ45_017981 [Haematococcus lacustris]
MLPVRQLAARALGARGWPWVSALCGDRLLQTSTEYHATTILVVRKDGHVCMIGDGQVSIGAMVAKPNANKLRRIGDTVIAGFAGSAADGLSLLERLENKLEEHPGNGDVLEPQDGVMGIGSGSPYAVAAARALLDIHGMDASSIAAKSMKIASDMCVYTNANFSTQTIAAPPVTPA